MLGLCNQQGICKVSKSLWSLNKSINKESSSSNSLTFVIHKQSSLFVIWSQAIYLKRIKPHHWINLFQFLIQQGRNIWTVISTDRKDLTIKGVSKRSRLSRFQVIQEPGFISARDLRGQFKFSSLTDKVESELERVDQLSRRVQLDEVRPRESNQDRSRREEEGHQNRN
jgi:hypothetical protein